MSELLKDKNGRIVFTKEMKKEYKILMPMMLPIHFTLLEKIFIQYGYNVELLKTSNENIINQGLQSVHNDTCYPALLVIGQFIDALKSGKYDINKTALVITQTGGGCRASNYIHLLRKALKKHNLEHIPIISFNLSGMEKNPGFKTPFSMVRKLITSILYGDLLMLLYNQTRPYEVNKGYAQNLVDKWIEKLIYQFERGQGLKKQQVIENLKDIVSDFDNIEILKTEKIKVGIVGEIYVKYSPLGNSNLEEFLFNEGVEVIVPGLLDFVIFKADNRIEDVNIYGGKYAKKIITNQLKSYLLNSQKLLIDAVKNSRNFTSPTDFEHIKSLVKGYLGYGNKMGEGWLLTGEMLELINAGVNNIVCTQPFGCLPNHISGKGMFRKIKTNYPNSNIVPIDYDPGATKVNQENRIKLMLATAKNNVKKD